MSRARGVVVVFGFAATLAAAGCQLIAGFQDFAGTGGLGTGPDGGACAPPDGSGDMVGQRTADGGCVLIEAREVTVGAYDVFLETSGTPQQSGDCATNTTFMPDPACMAMLPEAPSGQQPVVCIDWCDALAYCTSRHRRLCQGSPTAPADATQSEWYAACSNGGVNVYPYGSMYEANACRGGCTSNCSTVDVGTLPSCRTPSGVLDMSGNAAEWVDECGSLGCNVRGGGANDGETALACSGATPLDKLKTSPFVGFRCCGDL